MSCIDSFLQINRFIFILVFMLSALKISSSTCVKRTSCECVFKNGSVINLSSLGDKNNKARFESMKATKPDKYTYFFNPCYSFVLGSKNQDCAKGVSACQVLDDKEYYDIGDTDSVSFTLDNDNKLHLIYSAVPKRTNVTLVCSEDADEPELIVKGEEEINHYEMTLKSKCACPDLCKTEKHLSAGSILVIIFLIFVSLYLFLGIIHSNLTRGAQGWELIPHYEFWTDFPLLVRDGCVFVVSGCKAETAYEKI